MKRAPMVCTTTVTSAWLSFLCFILYSMCFCSQVAWSALDSFSSAATALELQYTAVFIVHCIIKYSCSGCCSWGRLNWRQILVILGVYVSSLLIAMCVCMFVWEADYRWSLAHSPDGAPLTSSLLPTEFVFTIVYLCYSSTGFTDA